MIGNFFSPSFYVGQYRKGTSALDAYYRPMFRAGSITPLWHFMVFTSVVMYTCTYLGKKKAIVQDQRKLTKKALEEYYEKHGGPAHH